MKKERSRKVPEINAGSMADIAFLLLIFFLVTTTIASDKGLTILLPPKREKDKIEEVEMKDREVFKVLVNSRNQLLVEEEPMSLERLRTAAKEFINNRGRDKEMSSSPQEAVVSYKTDRGTKYSIYIRVLDEIKGAYNELRAEFVKMPLDQFVSFDEKKAIEDPILLKKVKLFGQLRGENVSAKEYLNFNVNTSRDQKAREAYAKARNSGKTLQVERIYDASREYPLRISEAEPSKIGE